MLETNRKQVFQCPREAVYQHLEEFFTRLGKPLRYLENVDDLLTRSIEECCLRHKIRKKILEKFIFTRLHILAY